MNSKNLERADKMLGIVKGKDKSTAAPADLNEAQNTKNIQSTPAERDTEANLISEGVTIKASEISGNGDLRISGRVIGDIDLEGSVYVERGGNTCGNIKAKAVFVYGCVEGDISVKNAIHVYKDGKINGNILCSNLMIENGASFFGKCEMGREDGSDYDYVPEKWLDDETIPASVPASAEGNTKIRDLFVSDL